MGKKKVLSMVELPAPDVADGDMVMIVDASEPVDADKNKKLSLKGYVSGGGLIERTFAGITENSDLFTLAENEVIINAECILDNCAYSSLIRVKIDYNSLIYFQITQPSSVLFAIKQAEETQYKNNNGIVKLSSSVSWVSGSVDITIRTKILT